MARPTFPIRLANGLTFDSTELYAEACGYSLSTIASLRRKGLGWQAIWNRKRNGTPAQRAKRRRKTRRTESRESLFEPVPE